MVVEPENVRRSSAAGFDGVIASGGYLRAASYKTDLNNYSQLLDDLDRPFLGICLGLKIMGHYYGARMRRIEPGIGLDTIRFERDYPLAPGVRECAVYQSHSYELLPPLPDALENYASGASPIEAVKTRDKQRFGLQFHPELSGMPAGAIVRNFVSLC